MIPPALSVEIPLIVGQGEAITYVGVSVVEGGSEDYIDCEVLDEAGEAVLEWRRVQNRAARHHLLAGQYILRLGNEFQAAWEKVAVVTVRWESFAGGEPPPPSEFSNLRAKFR